MIHNLEHRRPYVIELDDCRGVDLPIGQRFRFDGTEYEVCESAFNDSRCVYCVCCKKSSKCLTMPKCGSGVRKDETPVHFVECES